MISVVVPVYRNARTLRELHARLHGSLDPSGPCEIIFVEDASPDDSLTVLEELRLGDPAVRLVRHGTNSGQQSSVLDGIGAALGDVVVIVDADLQDPPEFIPMLVAHLGPGAAAVFAARRGRYAGIARQATSRAFKQVLHALCGTPADAGLFVAIDGAMRQRLLAYPSPGPSVLAMIGCTRLPLASVPCAREPRRAGRSAYSFGDRLALGIHVLAWTAITRWRSSHA